MSFPKELDYSRQKPASVSSRPVIQRFRADLTDYAPTQVIRIEIPTSGRTTHLFPSDCFLEGKLKVTSDVNTVSIDGNIYMPQGTNREIFMGSASAYNYRIRVTGDDFIINEANSVDRLKYVYADTRWYITGGLTISGSLSKGSGSFKIDHP
jgi:hypothetical protein